MNRNASLQQLLTRSAPWDIAIIGGGATGMGIALDAASRGYAVCLLERADFGKGTSSRSTKLIHGGVRYLQQGNISLVTEALHERGLLRQNAPHLVHDLPFIVPNYAFWEAPFYGAGLRIYDLLAGKYGFGKSRHLYKEEVLAHIPTLEHEGLRGGILYYDGQFDDARLLIDLAHTAAAHGATLLNYSPVIGLVHGPDRQLRGLIFQDLESGAEHELRAKCIINAAGPFVDSVRTMDEPTAIPMIAPSQGAHIVLDKSFLPGDAAIMVPRTADKRVLFAIPWLGHTLVGTTDTPLDRPAEEPVPLQQEIDFILETAGKYLHKRPGRADILSLFAGIRPLVKAGDAQRTAALSRDHTVHIASSGLLTVAGGKWTTYRRMAQDAVNHAATVGGLEERPCVTESLRINAPGVGAQAGVFAKYGASAAQVRALVEGSADLGIPFHPALDVCAAQIIWAARDEMARTLEDALSRRTRALLLNARAAIAIAPIVAALMAHELNRDATWQQRQVAEFTTLAGHYLGSQ